METFQLALGMGTAAGLMCTIGSLVRGFHTLMMMADVVDHERKQQLKIRAVVDSKEARGAFLMTLGFLMATCIITLLK